MDSWEGRWIPALARVDMAVEQVQGDCEKVRGTSVDSELVEYFIREATADWVRPDEAPELFRDQVVLCWNARQARLRKELGE